MRRVLVTAVALAAIAVVAPAWAAAAPSPAGLTAVALDGSVDLAWRPVAGVTSYNVYRGTSATTVTTLISPVGGVSATGFTDANAGNGTALYYSVKPIVAGAESGSSLTVQATPKPRPCPAANAVVLENCFPGDTGWRVVNAKDPSAGGIEAFATASSINKTGSIDLKVKSSNASTFHAEIYRIGSYGGAGARLYSTVLAVPGSAQSACTSDASTGLYDCSSWATSLTVTTTASWPSGVYEVHLVRDDNGSDTEVVFVLRDDARTSDLVYGLPFTTYQAYNNYGGKSLYDFNSTGAVTVGGTPHAVKVSFDRPYQQVVTGQHDWFPSVDQATISWLEESGYDVSYVSDTDLESGALTGTHKAYMLGGHDEYYSAGMRHALEAARDAGTSLFVSGSNAVYWRIRFENGTGGSNRIEVCYKTTQTGVADPSGIPTTTWRDPAGANSPENALIGQMYIGDNAGQSFPLVVPSAQGKDRVFRFSGLDSQAPGASASVGTGLVGWEWDARAANGREPAGVVTLASSPVSGGIVQNYGQSTSPGSTTSNATKYTAASGALVFATGTIQWARGLAQNGLGDGEVNPKIRQVTTNVLEDMAVKPQSAIGDVTLDAPGPPWVTASSPRNGQLAVSTATTVTARFSRPMDPSTLTSAMFTVAKQGTTTPVPATVAYDASTTTATLTLNQALATSTQYVATLAAGVHAADGTALGSPVTWTFTTSSTATPIGSTVRINTGGAGYTALDGRVFAADANFAGGSANATTATVTGTSDPALYRDERWGQFTYSIPVQNATYDVTLHFVELFYTSGSCVGKRVFSMDIVNTPPSPDIANLDVCAQAGGANKALVKTVTGVQVTNGALTIRSVYGSADDPELAAIEITPSSAPAAPPTVVSQTPAAGATGIDVGVKPVAGFSRAMDASTITASSFMLKKPDGTTVAATVAYDAASATATLTPSAALALSTTYTATLATTIKASDGQPLQSPVSWSFTTSSSATTLSTVRINAGGPAYTTADGRAFLADQSFTGGSTNATTVAVTGTTDPALYQDERWGSFSYAIPVVNGTYDVTLHFVELYYTSGSCVGKRIFSMDIPQTTTSPDVSNLDVCSVAGGADKAYVKTISGVQATAGVINLQSIYGAADDPEIAAIEVTPSSSQGQPPPTPDQIGQWSAPQSWPIVTVHATLLPTGNVLAWDGFAAAPNSQRVWNPLSNTFVPVPYAVNIFCAGHITLPDGRVLIAGGHAGIDLGIPDTTIYNPSSGTWSAAQPMSVGRWYPTVTELADGRALVFSGDNIVQNRPGATPPFSDAAVNSLPEVFDPVTGTWTDLTGATLTSPLYPFMFVLSDGRILDAGPDTTTRILDPATWTWSTLGTSPFDGMSAVMYRPNKIMKAGSWADPDWNGTDQALFQSRADTAVLDMNSPSPAWRSTTPMQYARSYHNLTLLPDGTVLASGGQSTSSGTDISKAVLPAEIWNPTTEKWTTVASLTNGREYHSTALLLPDGRVLMAGGGQLPGSPAVNQTNAEIYSPPYLFKGARPTISSAPSLVQYGQSFTVQTPDAASITNVSLIRLPSVTHGFDQDQRFQFLNFTPGSGQLTVQSPANANLAPPGYYMLFLLNGSGVPSVASMVRLPAPWEDTVPPTAPGSLTANGGLGAATLSWAVATDNVGVTAYSVYRSTTSNFTPSLANRIAQTAGTSYTDSGLAAGTYYYRVQASDAAGNLGPSSNEASATVTADTTPPTVSVTAPAAGSTVSGSTTVSANASDDVGVVGVQFKLDGANLGAEDTTSPYSVSWDTTAAVNGSHMLTAVARDAAGHTTTSASVSVTVSNAGPSGGLVASYNFDAGTGTVLVDRSGGTNNGTITAGTWSTTGHTGAALSFNGTSTWVTIPDAPALDLTTGMTLEAWVRPSALGTAWRNVIFKEQTGGMVYSLYANQDTTRPVGQVNIGGEVNAVGTAALALNAWTHLALTFDGQAVKLYVNGTLVQTTLIVGAIPASTGVLHLGGDAVWGEWYKGLMDDVRIYSRSLSPAEIQTDMNTPVG